MQTIRVVLFRSPVLVGAALIAVIEITLALTRHTIGFNLWADRVNGLTSASIVVGVVAAGVSAVEANRWFHVHRHRANTAARSWFAVRTQHVGAVLLPLFAAYWIAVLVVAVQAIASDAYGTPSWPWLLSLGCAVLFSAMIGYTIGAVLPQRWYVGPFVGLSLYACYALLIVANVPYGLLSLFPANSNYDSVFTRPIAPTFLGETAFFLAGAVALMLLLGVHRRRAWTALGTLATAVLVAAIGGGMVLSTNGQATTGHNPRDFSRAGSDPVLCLNTGYASASPALHTQFHHLNILTTGTPLAADRLEQNVEGVGDAPRDGARSVYLEQWAAADDLTFAVYRYVQKYGGSVNCESEDTAARNSAVDSWLADYYESTAGAGETPMSRALAGLDDAAGAEWFKTHYRAYASCSLTAEAMP